MSFHLPSSSRWASRSPRFGPSHATDRRGRPRPADGNGFAVKSPLAEGIAPGNLKINGEGTVRVNLRCDWEEMLADLREVGRLLVISRNEAAVIARYMTYPVLSFERREGEAEDEEGQFDLDLRWWRSAYARHSRMPKGEGYAIEMLDARSQAFHSIVLTQDSSLSHFKAWVQKYQARPDSAPSVARNAAASRPAGMRRDDSIDSWEERDRRRPMDRTVLLPLLRRVVESGMPMRAVVGHEAIIQGHAFIPRNVRESGSWIFCSDDETGLHFDLAGVSSVTLPHFDLQGRECRVLKACHADGRLLFFLAPGRSGHLELWNRLLETVHP